MYYRTLYSKETLKQEIENVDIYISNDRSLMDDFILIYYYNRIQVACILNYNIMYYMNVDNNKSFSGIVLFVNNNCNIGELINRYTDSVK